MCSFQSPRPSITGQRRVDLELEVNKNQYKGPLAKEGGTLGKIIESISNRKPPKLIKTDFFLISKFK